LIYELSKSQKKIARQLIDKGLQIECGECLKKVESFLDKSKTSLLSNHETYLKLYQLIIKFDKHVAQCYDGLSGSHYFTAVLGLFVNDVITMKDIEAFDEEIRNKLIALKKSLSEE
jgi:flagellar basal body-associated protein FliL